MFLVLHRKVGSISTLSKTLISDFWTPSTLTHRAQCCVSELLPADGKVTLVGESRLPQVPDLAGLRVQLDSGNGDS